MKNIVYGGLTATKYLSEELEKLDIEDIFKTDYMISHTIIPQDEYVDFIHYLKHIMINNSDNDKKTNPEQSSTEAK